MAFVIPIINTLLLLGGVIGLIVGLAIAPWQIQLLLLLIVLLGTQYLLRKTGAIKVFEQFQDAVDPQEDPESKLEPSPSDLPPWAALANQPEVNQPEANKPEKGASPSFKKTDDLMHHAKKLIYRGHGYPPHASATAKVAPEYGASDLFATESFGSGPESGAVAIANHHGAELRYRGVKLNETASQEASKTNSPES